MAEMPMILVMASTPLQMGKWYPIKYVAPLYVSAQGQNSTNSNAPKVQILKEYKSITTLASSTNGYCKICTVMIC